MIHVGISGWNYPPWRGVFYPKGLPHKRELPYVVEHLNSVEINGSFYALQRRASWESWYAQARPGFVYSVKGSRYISHMKKLAGIEQPLANFLASGLLALDDRLGPILWQLPPTLGFDAERLDAFFAVLPRTTGEAAEFAKGHDERIKHGALTEAPSDRPLRYALEVRHQSFRNPEFIALARERDFAVVVADTAGKWPLIEEVTTDFMYVRLHGDVELYASGYSDQALDGWARKIRRWKRTGEVFVYFDNDVKVRAPFDAMSLSKKLGIQTS
ncbi:MAG TPA: DUF72 domain-containing protein [Mycobacteriales bacterium]|nr:DUF72 domain-containing protein [Mycobacteriales bacterium]